jgi:prevent-host-death family protein
VKTISKPVLRNESGEVLRQAEAGQRFMITVDGRPATQLGPVPRREWVPKPEYLQLIAKGGHDPDFFDDLAEISEPIESGE